MASGVWIAALTGCYPDSDSLRVAAEVDRAAPPGADAAGVGGQGGGSGAGPADSGANTDSPPERACDDYAANWCAAFDRCFPVAFRRDHGNVDQCRTAYRAFCQRLGKPGMRWPTRDCATAYAQLSCDVLNVELVFGTLPDVCRVPGPLKADATCDDALQCEGQRCVTSEGSPDQSCGVCSVLARKDEGCGADHACEPGLVCSGPERDKRCRTPVAAGASCSVTQPCRRPLACRNGVCAPQGAAGASCTDAVECDLMRGAACTDTGRCIAYDVSSSGCGTVVNGAYLFCPATGFCAASMCRAAVADGAACSNMNGPHCAPPARCVNGRCALGCSMPRAVGGGHPVLPVDVRALRPSFRMRAL